MVVPPVKDALKDMQLSDQEMQKFEKAFRDPEFIRMFGEYAKEMQDPANRAETDAYLRQLEQQGEIERTYGKGTQLIVPDPQFCFKTRSKPCGTKVFVNVCSSDKVEKPSVTSAKDAQGKSGQQWHLPLAGSNLKRNTTDKKGNTAWVWDVTMHTETFTMLSKQPRLLNLIVESAIEHIENTNKVQLDRQFSRPKLRFKGTPENPDKPAVTAIRGDAAVAENGTLKPKQVPPSSLEHTVASSGEENTCEAMNGTTSADTDTKYAGVSARSPFRFKQPKAKVPRSPADAGYLHAGGEVTPAYTIVHQGQQDLADTWSDPTVQAKAIIPQALVVRVELPKMQSVDDAELDVGPTRAAIKVPAMYLLDIALPFKVEDGRGSAKFDSATKSLKLWLPVLKSQRGIPHSCNTSAASAAAETARESIEKKVAENIESVDEEIRACDQQGSDGPAVECSVKGDAQDPTADPEPSTAEPIKPASILAEASVGGGQDGDGNCDRPRGEGVDTGVVDPPADTGTAAQRAASIAQAAGDCPREGISAGTAKCQGSAPQGKAAEKSQQSGGNINLKALALQWDSVHRACDAEMSAGKSEPVVCDANSAPVETKEERAPVSETRETAKKAVECVPESTPDVQLGLALDLPMLGELD